jgi:cohesin loading factor subunit SCC2
MLHSKHASLLNTRFAFSAKASFDYQKKLSDGRDIQGKARWFAVERQLTFGPGYRMQPIPTALLQRWYSLVREKRTSRQDFLKSLVKVFDLPISLHSTQVREGLCKLEFRSSRRG